MKDCISSGVVVNSILGKGVTLGITILLVITACGTIYGWSALLLVFKQEGVYQEKCGNSENQNQTITVTFFYCLNKLKHNLN